jgi:hypothetical protein
VSPDSLSRLDLGFGPVVAVLSVVDDEPASGNNFDAFAGGPISTERVRAEERFERRLTLVDGDNRSPSQSIDGRLDNPVLVRHRE